LTSKVTDKGVAGSSGLKIQKHQKPAMAYFLPHAPLKIDSENSISVFCNRPLPAYSIPGPGA